MSATDFNARPSILILCPPRIPAALDAVLHGIEEEGIPWEIEHTEPVSNSYAIDLAYQAASRSRLEVGVGLDTTGCVALHYRRLQAHMPLFTEKLDHPDAQLRLLGINAARLVKGMPFEFMD